MRRYLGSRGKPVKQRSESSERVLLPAVKTAIQQHSPLCSKTRCGPQTCQLLGVFPPSTTNSPTAATTSWSQPPPARSQPPWSWQKLLFVGLSRAFVHSSSVYEGVSEVSSAFAQQSEYNCLQGLSELTGARSLITIPPSCRSGVPSNAR